MRWLQYVRNTVNYNHKDVCKCNTLCYLHYGAIVQEKTGSLNLPIRCNSFRIFQHQRPEFGFFLLYNIERRKNLLRFQSLQNNHPLWLDLLNKRLLQSLSKALLVSKRKKPFYSLLLVNLFVQNGFWKVKHVENWKRLHIKWCTYEWGFFEIRLNQLNRFFFLTCYAGLLNSCTI